MLIIVNFRWWNSSNSFHNFFSEYMLLLYLKKWYLCLHLQKVSLVAPTVKKKKKKSSCSAGDLGLIPGLGKSPGEGYGNPLQYSLLENPHGQRSLAGYSPWGRKESDTTDSTYLQNLASALIQFISNSTSLLCWQRETRKDDGHCFCLPLWFRKS